jgi:hypothetical protein
MTTSNDLFASVPEVRRSVTITGLFNEQTGSFDLKPMFVGAQLPVFIADREEAVRKMAYQAGQAEENRRDAREYWLEAEQEFDAHTLIVVTSNTVYGTKSFMLPLNIVCRDGAAWDGIYLFAGDIPYVPRVDGIDFYRARERLHHFDVPHALPQVVLHWRPEDAAPSGRGTVNWHGEHAEGRTLYYYLTYESLDGRLEPLSMMTEANEMVVDFTSLPAGVSRLRLTASDGYNTVDVRSPRFFVPHQPCTAFIFSPAEGAVLAGGRMDLAGRGLYDDGRTEEVEALEWISDRDGSLGRGALLPGVVLSPGRHTITLVAGLPGAENRTSVEVDAQEEVRR